MPYYIVHLRRTDEDNASSSPAAHEAVSRLDEARREGWTPASILRDDIPICEQELREDAQHERWLD